MKNLTKKQTAYYERDRTKPTLTTYDVLFTDVKGDSCNVGMVQSFEWCKDYIDNCLNRKNDRYFNKFKGGTVSIFRIQTDETIFKTKII